MTTFVACPECLLPAEITDRFRLPSTDGPVEHVRVSCVAHHHFCLPLDKVVAASRSAGEPGAADQAPPAAA